MDVLKLLRYCIVKKLQLVWKDAHGSPTQEFNDMQSLVFPAAAVQAVEHQPNATDLEITRDTLTAFKDKINEDLFPIDAVYFAYLKRDVSHAEYFQECQKLRVKTVSLILKRDLFDYLSGASKESVNVDWNLLQEKLNGKRMQDSSLGDGDPASGKRPRTAASTANDTFSYDAAQPRERSFATKERVLVDRKSVTSCSSQKTFESVRKIAVQLILSKSASSHAPPSAKSDPKAGSSPIIIVPAALTSLVTLYNVKSFLESSKFQTTDDARKAVNGVKTSPVVFQHAHSKVQTKLNFQVVDAVEKLSEADWHRVVAVFVSGHIWQFKGWKWEEPVDIFSHVKGFFLKFADTKTDPMVKQWNVTVLEVNRYKRHLDAQCVHQFWSVVDHYIQSAKPHLMQPATKSSSAH